MALAALAACAAFTPAARAGLLPVQFSTAPEGANTRYTYGIVLQTDSFIKSGDFFTIYDFAGFIPGSQTAPSGWGFALNAVTKTPGNVVPNDDPSLPDLTWTYTGPTIYGEKGLGNFSALSSFNHTDWDSFTARTHRTIDGHVDSNITDTQVPVPGAPTPEPATLLLLGLGLPLAGAARLLRRRAV
jgi:hypothetical protein